MSDPVCGWMGCKHPRTSHDGGLCTEKTAFHNELLYGFRQPLIYKVCGCTWVEPVQPERRLVKDGPQA